MKSSKEPLVLRRRELFGLVAAVWWGVYPRALSSNRFKLCICNEMFQGWTFSETCKASRCHGYGGLEIAPFTLSEDPASLPASERARLRATMQNEGVEFVGLHWLLSAPKGLHVTTPDRVVRERSWRYFARLIDLCADLGDGGVMVFGSGRQRGTTDGAAVPEATARLTAGLAEMAPLAEARGVTILLETLAPHLCDVVTSLAEAVQIVREIGSPAVQTMFDTHNAVAETVPHDELIRTHYDHIRHVHINEMDGGYPGTGDYDFRPVLVALKDLGYDRWISLEVFDLTPGAERIAQESYNYIRRLEREIDQRKERAQFPA